MITLISGYITFIYLFIDTVCLRGWKDGCNFAVGKEREQSTTNRVQSTTTVRSANALQGHNLHSEGQRPGQSTTTIRIVVRPLTSVFLPLIVQR